MTRKLVPVDEMEVLLEANRPVVCDLCGGTILPHAMSGASRGSCHCPKEGRIKATLLYSTETTPGGRRTYAIEWCGEVVVIDPPTLANAMAELTRLRLVEGRGTTVWYSARDEVIRDPTEKNADTWRVVWDDIICTPVFNSPGAAAACLDMYRRGQRRPELPEGYRTRGTHLQSNVITREEIL